MNWEQTVRWLGMICLTAGVARMGMTPSAILWGTDSWQELTFGFIACILMSVGTVAAYLVQSRETGVFGFITTLLIIIGNIVITCMLWSVFVFGNLTEPAGALVIVSRILSIGGLTLGTLIFAFLTFRARVFPRWVAGLQLCTLLSMLLPFDEWFAFFWGLSYVGMGYTIWAGKLNRQPSVESSSIQAAGAGQV
jgi:hypothetical protein